MALVRCFRHGLWTGGGVGRFGHEFGKEAFHCITMNYRDSRGDLSIESRFTYSIMMQDPNSQHVFMKRKVQPFSICDRFRDLCAFPITLNTPEGSIGLSMCFSGQGNGHACRCIPTWHNMSGIIIIIGVHIPPCAFRMEPHITWPTTLDICMNAAISIKTVITVYVRWSITVAVPWIIWIQSRRWFRWLWGSGW
jgi:hypothetical protein